MRGGISSSCRTRSRNPSNSACISALGAAPSIRRASARISGQMSAARISPAPSSSTTAAMPSRLPVTDISEPGGTGGTGGRALDREHHLGASPGNAAGAWARASMRSVKSIRSSSSATRCCRTSTSPSRC